MQTTEQLPRFTSRSQLAAIFGVDPRAVDRWQRQGLITPVTTPGGRAKYRTADVVELAEARGFVPREGWSAFYGLPGLTPNHDQVTEG